MFLLAAVSDKAYPHHPLGIYPDLMDVTRAGSRASAAREVGPSILSAVPGGTGWREGRGRKVPQTEGAVLVSTGAAMLGPAGFLAVSGVLIPDRDRPMERRTRA